MGFLSWLITKLGGATSLGLGGMRAYADEYAALVGDVYIREMAFVSAVNYIAKGISKCEFKTFLRGVEEQGNEYYLWNIEPNQNQNSSEFIQQWIYKLYRNNECLIIENNGKLYVADSFVKKPYALLEDVFTQVTIKDFTFDRSFVQSEVLYFKLCDKNIAAVVSGLFDSYSSLIAYSMNAYKKSRGTKGIFKYKGLPKAGTDERKVFDDLINEKIKAWLEGNNAALPLGDGLDWKELEHKTYSNESTRDIKAQIDDIFEFTFKGFGIHPAIAKGDIQGTKDAVDQTLTFCIDPLADMLQEEINRKRNGRTAYLEGTRLKISTKQIKHVDMLSVTTAIDKLIGSGFSFNQVLELCGEEKINEPWANAHFITKNYSTFEEALKQISEGGEA